MDAGDQLDGGAENGVGQDAAVLAGGLAEAVDGHEELLGPLVVALGEGLEDGPDLVAEDVGTAADQTHGALDDGGQEHHVVAVVDGKVGIHVLGGQEEVGDLGGVDAGLVLDAHDVGEGGQAADRLGLQVHAHKDGDVVEHDVGFGGLGQGLEVAVQALLGGLVVEGADHQAGLDAQIHRLVGQGDGLLGGGATGAGDNGLAPGGGLDGGLHQLHPLVKGEQAGLAGGAGDDEGIAQVVLNEVLDEFGILAVVHLFVGVIGGDEGQQDLAVLFHKLIHDLFPPNDSIFCCLIGPLRGRSAGKGAADGCLLLLGQVGDGAPAVAAVPAQHLEGVLQADGELIAAQALPLLIEGLLDGQAPLVVAVPGALPHLHALGGEYGEDGGDGPPGPQVEAGVDHIVGGRVHPAPAGRLHDVGVEGLDAAHALLDAHDVLGLIQQAVEEGGGDGVLRDHVVDDDGQPHLPGDGAVKTEHAFGVGHQDVVGGGGHHDGVGPGLPGPQSGGHRVPGAHPHDAAHQGLLRADE